MTIAVSGASGFVGRALTAVLGQQGQRVLRFTRRAPGPDEVGWDPIRGSIEAEKLEGTSAVIHLAGENIGQRWTQERKRLIRDSRVLGTGLLAKTLAGLRQPPATFISASAMGYYGPTPAGLMVDESAGPGADFLANVTLAWEEAAAPARAAGIRVMHPRFGNVLHPDGGALERLLPPFRAGLGGKLGNGQQPFSWITRDDAVAALVYAIRTPELSGGVNVTAPTPTTNAGFTSALGKALGRPAIMRVPGFVLRAALGEMADGLLLTGVAMKPTRLLQSGFVFQQPTLAEALSAILRA